jgi:hypothetical protein
MNLSTVTSVSLVIVTAGLVAVGIWGVCETRTVLELSERGWVSPVSIGLIGNPEAGKPIRFQIAMVNTGHEPAIDVNFGFKNATIDSYDPDITDIRNVQVPANDTCAGLAPVKDRFVIVPSMVGIASLHNFDSGHAEPQLFADERIVNGSKYYVLLGCLAYMTFDKTRYSSFCYILASRIANTEMDKAKPPVMQRIYFFDTCYTGFRST